jgi:small subunit ribosomal protein S19e
MSQKSHFFTVKDVSSSEFIKAYADHLKKNNKLEIPKWATYVKLSVVI